MEGFLRLRLPNWARRLITRAIAIVPVIVVTVIYGENGTAQLLVLSQMILSMQLPFAIIPLVRFVSNREQMDVFAIGRVTAALAWAGRRNDHRRAECEAACGHVSFIAASCVIRSSLHSGGS